MRYEFFVGWRYLRKSSRQSNSFISFISLISSAGLALGVAALIIVLSVMNGFQKEVRDKILSVASHIEVRSETGRLENWQSLSQDLNKHPGILATAPYVSGQTLLSFQGQARGALLRGIDPEREQQVGALRQYFKLGQLDDLVPSHFCVALGKELARSLNVQRGDKLQVLSPSIFSSIMGAQPRVKSFTVCSIFEAGLFEFDSGLALTHLEDAQKFLSMDTHVTGLRLKVDDLFEAPRIVQTLTPLLPDTLFATDWSKSHANFFRALALEKTMMFLILFLIVAVAAFNIVSTLVMAVSDKQADIAILRTLGATPRSIMLIFATQGMLIGFSGLLVGTVFGCLCAYNLESILPLLESLVGFKILSADVYYISDLPSDPQLKDILCILLFSGLLTLLSTLYPSFKASQVDPAVALKRD